MNKQAPNAPRILLMAGFALSCFGLLLFLWVAFGGPTPLKAKGYRFHASFGEATQLAKEADVRISGVSVGKVKTIEPSKKTGRADAVIELDRAYAPLPKDTRAILRQKTLLGETYVELTPGNPAKGTIPENGNLSATQVSPTVELDEIFRTFDPQTRKAFQTWTQQQALAGLGRARDINDALGNLSTFADDSDVLLQILQSQSGDVRRLVRNTGTVFDALSERGDQLSSLIRNSNAVFATTARRNAELADTFRVLPTFEKESTATVNRLVRFSASANPLITQLRPAARELSPTLTDLGALAPDLKALFKDLDPLITASKKGLPATERFLDELHPALAAADPVLRQLNPMIAYLARYPDEINAFFANVVAATEASDTPLGAKAGTRVHYLRTTNPLNLENLAQYPVRLFTNRNNPYAMPDSFRNLRDGLPSYETRQCKNGPIPSLGGLTDNLLGLLPQTLRDDLQKFVFDPASKAVAPPCKQAGKFDVGGELTQFPHVKAASGGTARAARARAAHGR